MRVELPVKRLYLPGVRVKSKCPKCGKKQVWSGDQDYLSYPTLGAWEEVSFYCDEGHEDDCVEWSEKVKLVLTVETK